MGDIFTDPGQAEEILLSELYHENSKIFPNAPKDFNPLESYNISETRIMSNGGRRYRGLDRISLQTSKTPSMSLEDAIFQRRTRRDFSKDALTLEELSGICLATNGINGTQDIPAGGSLNLRTAPSAGGLYPLEMYLFVSRVTGLERGLYHFDPKSSELAMLQAGFEAEELSFCCCHQAQATTAAMVIVFTAVFHRTIRKYGSRGYRYALLDVMTSGGFHDDALHSMIGVDGVDECAIYLAFVGHQAKS
jgi:SagB-type dehydrogenase family enzyme